LVDQEQKTVTENIASQNILSPTIGVIKAAGFWPDPKSQHRIQKQDEAEGEEG
jgi:hypothetical protein